MKKTLLFLLTIIIATIVTFVGVGCSDSETSPYSVYFGRSSSSRDGRIMYIENHSSTPLKVWVQGVSYDILFEHTASQWFTIPPKTKQEVHIEGWYFTKGEDYTIKAEGYPYSTKGIIP